MRKYLLIVTVVGVIFYAFLMESATFAQNEIGKTLIHIPDQRLQWEVSAIPLNEVIIDAGSGISTTARIFYGKNMIYFQVDKTTGNDFLEKSSTVDKIVVRSTESEKNLLKTDYDRLQQIAVSLMMFNLEIGRPVSNLDDLTKSQIDSHGFTKKPYLSNEVLIDPWGNPYFLDIENKTITSTKQKTDVNS